MFLFLLFFKWKDAILLLRMSKHIGECVWNVMGYYLDWGEVYEIYEGRDQRD